MKSIFGILLTFFLHCSCARDFRIRSDQDFLTAINTVRPGDVIHLFRDTIYYLQNVELTRSGHPNALITLNGDRGTKIISDNTGLVIRGSYWKIQNIAFENSQTGIYVYGNNNTLKSLSFHDIEEEGLVLRGNGNLVKNSVFNAASHGIIVSGRDNVLLKNSITCMVTSVTATPRSCCGHLEGNVFNGLLNVLGGEYSIVKNIANSDVSIAGQRNAMKGNVINGQLLVSGCGNTFLANTAGKTDFTSTCYNWDDGDNHFGGSLGAVVSNTGGNDNGQHKPNNPGVSNYPQGSGKPGSSGGGNYYPGQPGSGNHNHQGQQGQPGNSNYWPGQPGQPGNANGNNKPGSGNYYPPGKPGAASYPQGQESGGGKPGKPGGSTNYYPGKPGNRPVTVNRPGYNYVHISDS